MMSSLVKVLLFVFVNAPLHCLCVNPADIIYAVNAGGKEHVDVNGIRFRKDSNKNGIASDYGKNVLIQRISLFDQILYQTERYSLESFSYTIPFDVRREGNYVLVLKFSEVYFQNPGEKVFSVVLNGLPVLQYLDIFEEVGFGVAYDVYIEFKVSDSTIYWNKMQSRVLNKKITVGFVKGHKDNPKINAFYIAHCTIKDIPKLPKIPSVSSLHPPEYDEAAQLRELEVYLKEKRSRKYGSKPKYIPLIPEPNTKVRVWYFPYLPPILFLLLCTVSLYFVSYFV